MTARVLALAVVATLTLVPTAAAAPVFFVNPEGLERHTVSTNLAPDPFEFIDVTKPASQQPPLGSDPLPGSAFVWVNVTADGGVPTGNIIGGAWKASTLPAGTPNLGFAFDPEKGRLAIHQFGDTIADGLFGDVSLELLQVLLPGDSTGFLGLRFVIWNAVGTDFTTHFGWMQVDWLGEGLSGGVDLDILAWGFETTPDTPIAAGAGLPAPGGAPLLALAGAFAARRRRRG